MSTEMLFRSISASTESLIDVEFDGSPSKGAGARLGGYRLAGRRRVALALHACVRSAACALLHDGRLLRMPAGNRRRGESTGLPRDRATGHEDPFAGRRSPCGVVRPFVSDLTFPTFLLSSPHRPLSLLAKEFAALLKRMFAEEIPDYD